MKRIILATLCIVLFASCSTLRISGPRVGATYDRKVPMAIVPYHDDSETGYIILSANLRGKKDARQTVRELVRRMNVTFR